MARVRAVTIQPMPQLKNGDVIAGLTWFGATSGTVVSCRVQGERRCGVLVKQDEDRYTFVRLNEIVLVNGSHADTPVMNQYTRKQEEEPK